MINNIYLRITLMVSLVAIISAITFTTIIVVLNFQNVIFAIRRPDIIEAGKKVEDEEQRIIQQKIAEIKKQTVKKILSPLVQKP